MIDTFVFNIHLELPMLLGIILIVGSGVLSLWREKAREEPYCRTGSRRTGLGIGDAAESAAEIEASMVQSEYGHLAQPAGTASMLLPVDRMASKFSSAVPSGETGLYGGGAKAEALAILKILPMLAAFNAPRALAAQCIQPDPLDDLDRDAQLYCAYFISRSDNQRRRDEIKPPYQCILQCFFIGVRRCVER